MLYVNLVFLHYILPLKLPTIFLFLSKPYKWCFDMVQLSVCWLHLSYPVSVDSTCSMRVVSFHLMTWSGPRPSMESSSWWFEVIFFTFHDSCCYGFCYPILDFLEFTFFSCYVFNAENSSLSRNDKMVCDPHGQLSVMNQSHINHEALMAQVLGLRFGVIWSTINHGSDHT